MILAYDSPKEDTHHAAERELARQTAELLEQISAGDQRAMIELYRRFSALVMRDVLRQLKDKAIAEEVVQDTMYEIWRYPQRFRGDSKFSTFLVGIARNKVRDALRKGRRIPIAAAANEDEMAKLMEDIPWPGLDPADEIGEQQWQQGLRRCIEKLPDAHGDCLHLTYVMDMSIDEVAQIQNCPPNTVKTRLFHARQKIKNCLRLLQERS